MLIFTISTSVWAMPSCAELEKDLLRVEYQIQNSKLAICDDEIKNQGFCRPENATQGHENNKYYQELLEDYNRAMGALMLAKGINTIGAAIKGSHNSLAAIEAAEIEKTNDYMDVLKENLHKSKILYAAMEAVPSKDKTFRTSFWERYGFSANNTLEEFKSNLVKTCIVERPLVQGHKDNIVNPQTGDEFKDENGNKVGNKLCSKIFTVDHANKEDVWASEPQLNKDVEMLYAYSKAEMQQQITGQDPSTAYRTNRDKLLISDGKDNRTPEKFEADYFGEGKPHAVLEKAITSYFKEGGKGKTKENAKAIFKAATALDEIEVGYNIPNGEKLAPLDKFFKENLVKPELAVDPTDNIITDVWSNNTKHHAKKVKSEYQKINKGLEFDAKDIMNNLSNINCNNKDKPVECVKQMCGIKENTSDFDCNNTDVVAVVDNNFFELLKKANELKSFSNKMEKAVNCYEEKSNNTLSKKQECLDKVKKSFSKYGDLSNIDELTKKVTEAKNFIIKYNGAQPFKSLKLEKALAVSALQKKNCIGDQLQDVKYRCKNDLAGIADERILELSDDLADISIVLEDELLEASTGDWRKGQRGTASYIPARDTYMEKCDRDQAICRFYHDEADTYREQEERQRQLDAQRKITAANKKKIKPPKTRVGGSFLGGFGRGMIASTPLLATELARYDSTKAWQKQQLNTISMMEDQYQKRLEYYDWLKENGWYNNGYFGSNWGWNNYSDAYTYNSNFGGTGSYDLYSDTSNYYQFNFSTPSFSGVNSYVTPNTTFGSYNSGYNSGSGSGVYEFGF